MLRPYRRNIIYLSYRNARVRFFFRLRALLIFCFFSRFELIRTLYTDLITRVRVYAITFTSVGCASRSGECMFIHIYILYIYNKTGRFTEVRTPTHFPSRIIYYVTLYRTKYITPLISQIVRTHYFFFFGHTYYTCMQYLLLCMDEKKTKMDEKITSKKHHERCGTTAICQTFENVQKIVPRDTLSRARRFRNTEQIIIIIIIYVNRNT